MQFKSIEEIKAHFQLDSTDSKELRKALKKVIKPLHPDKNGGLFRSDHDKNLYYDAQNAMSFLDAQKERTEVTLIKESQALSRVNDELNDLKRIHEAKVSIQNKSDNLSSKIQNSISQFHSKNRPLKITSTAIATIVTFFWAFPGITKDHPILSSLPSHYKEFTIFWLFSLVASAILWVKTKSLEKQDENLKREYRLESMQNRLFDMFALWSYSIGKSYELDEKEVLIKFSKESLMSFFSTRFNYYNSKYYLINENKYIWEKEKVINEVEKNYRIKYDRHYDQKVFRSIFKLQDIMPQPEEIDLELAESVCGLVIERLIAKNAIKKIDDNQLIDQYQYKLPRK